MKPSKNQADLLIVGGGVLGAFHAYHAIGRGLKVILLERHRAPRGATVRNFGQVVPSGMDRHWQAFGRESLATYKSIQSRFDISIRQHGSIYIASDDEELTLIEELRSINADNDYPSELWTVRQCRDRYPQLQTDYCRGGLFFPEEVSVNPRVMIHRLHDFLAEQSNYQSRFRCCVGEIAASSQGQVTASTTDGDCFTADKAIVCCGCEFHALFPESFRASDLEAVKLQMLRIRPQRSVTMPGNVLTGLTIRRYESFAECPSWQHIKSHEPPDSFWKQWGVHILFKQESDGGIILGDSHQYVPASRIDQLDFDLQTDINNYFVSEGRRIFDLPNWDIEKSWFGIYCQTSHPSGIFTKNIGKNIHIVTGIGGKGLTGSAGFANYFLGEIYND